MSLGIGPADRLTNANPIDFDNSVFDIYAGLLNGAAIVALDALKGLPTRRVGVGDHQASVLVLLRRADPVHVPGLGASAETLIGCRASARFRIGGEGFPLARLRRFHDAFAGKAKLINCYGPTQTSCICSGFEIVEVHLRHGRRIGAAGTAQSQF